MSVRASAPPSLEGPKRTMVSAEAFFGYEPHEGRSPSIAPMRIVQYDSRGSAVSAEPHRLGSEVSYATNSSQDIGDNYGKRLARSAYLASKGVYQGKYNYVDKEIHISNWKATGMVKGGYVEATGTFHTFTIPKKDRVGYTDKSEKVKPECAEETAPFEVYDPQTMVVFRDPDEGSRDPGYFAVTKMDPGIPMADQSGYGKTYVAYDASKLAKGTTIKGIVDSLLEYYDHAVSEKKKALDKAADKAQKKRAKSDMNAARARAAGLD